MKKIVISFIVLLYACAVFAQSNPLWVNRYNGVGDFSDKWNASAIDASGNIFLVGSSIIKGNDTDIITAKLNANGDTLWVRTYDGNKNGDKGNGIKIDASGNVFIAGTINRSNTDDDVITIKYNSVGDTLWTRIFNNLSVNQDEAAIAVELDASGNVYVTGSSDTDPGAAINDDYLTIKYNTSGVQQWVQTFNGAGNLGDVPVGLGIDNSGNVYVAGKSFNGTNDDYVTIKYNSTGTQAWLQTYDGGANDRAAAMRTDPNGNTYVTGRSKSTNDDYYTIAYNTSGAPLWSAVYDGAGAGNDRPQALACDSNGNVFVTGQSDVDATALINYDYLTIKYNSMGTEIWTVGYNGMGNNNDIPADIAIDVNGNVFVTGKADADATINTNNDYATLKYNSNGIQQWVKTLNGSANLSDAANTIAVDASGNCFVSGLSNESNSQKNGTTVKYNATGVQQWIKYYNAEGDNSDNGSAITVDGSGNSYVAGYTFGNGSERDICVVKINSSGDTLWVKKIDGSAGKTDQANAIAVDASGNVYITGYAKNKITGNDFLTIKFNALGDTVWTRPYNGLGNGTDKATSIFVDAVGNVYVTGSTDNDPSVLSNDDYVTVKYNSAGLKLWAATFNGAANGTDKASGMLVDASGNVFVTGKSFNGTNYDIVTVKYNSAGVQQNSIVYSGGNGDDVPNAIAIDGNSNIYITGQSVAANLLDDCITLKYNSALTQTWLQTFNGTGNKNDRNYAIALDASGNVYVTGETDILTAPLDKNYDCLTIKYNSSGVQQWVKTYNGQANTDDLAAAVAVDGLGNIFITGQAENALSASPNKDYITIKYNALGDTIWTSTYNGSGNGSDGANAMTIDNAGNIYITGSSYSSAGQKDMVTIKYSGIPLSSNELSVNQSQVMVYPNPFSTQASISIASDYKIQSWVLKVYDATGKMVLSQNVINTNQTNVKNTNLSKGVYFYQAVEGARMLGSGEFIITE